MINYMGMWKCMALIGLEIIVELWNVYIILIAPCLKLDKFLKHFSHFQLLIGVLNFWVFDWFNWFGQITMVKQKCLNIVVHDVNQKLYSQVEKKKVDRYVLVFFLIFIIV